MARINRLSNLLSELVSLNEQQKFQASTPPSLPVEGGPRSRSTSPSKRSSWSYNGSGPGLPLSPTSPISKTREWSASPKDRSRSKSPSEWSSVRSRSPSDWSSIRRCEACATKREQQTYSPSKHSMSFNSSNYALTYPTSPNSAATERQQQKWYTNQKLASTTYYKLKNDLENKDKAVLQLQHEMKTFDLEFRDVVRKYKDSLNALKWSEESRQFNFYLYPLLNG